MRVRTEFSETTWIKLSTGSSPSEAHAATSTNRANVRRTVSSGESPATRVPCALVGHEKGITICAPTPFSGTTSKPPAGRTAMASSYSRESLPRPPPSRRTTERITWPTRP